MRGAIVVAMIGCGGGGHAAAPDAAAIAHCRPAPFTGITPTVVLTPAEEVALPTRASFTITGMSGWLFERDASFANPQMIDLGPYLIATPSVTPEGDELFYTPSIEPMMLHTAHRIAPDQWIDMHDAPPGAMAGRPSAGPMRRVFVDANGVGLGWQEYKQTASGWTAVGAPVDATALFGADHGGSQLGLSDDGLLLLFTASAPGDFTLRYAVRTSLDEPFQTSTLLLDGVHRDASLSEDCTTLTTIEGQNVGEAIERFVQP
ncbi:MAG: hypothetical protein JO257_35140 [Deltaproteobacteria bacterium]|nr:hypothetical protein [Deltaproteobacteria bacterium]